MWWVDKLAMWWVDKLAMWWVDKLAMFNVQSSCIIKHYTYCMKQHILYASLITIDIIIIKKIFIITYAIQRRHLAGKEGRNHQLYSPAESYSPPLHRPQHTPLVSSLTSAQFPLLLTNMYQLKLIKMRVELANLNDCAVPF